MLRNQTRDNGKTLRKKLGTLCTLILGFIVVSIIYTIHSIRHHYADTLTSPKANDIHFNYNLAKRHSFGFFDDVSEDEWKLLQKIVGEHVNHAYVKEPLTFNPQFSTRNLAMFNSNFAWYQNNYEPNFSCRFERRVGGNGNGDGPKWICDPHRIARIAQQRKQKDAQHPGCVVYSIGSNGDFSFEMGMQKSVGVGICEFHIFDMGDYEEKMPKELVRAHYHRWGVGEQKENAGKDPPEPFVWKGKQFYSLKDTIKVLGHDTLDAIDVFKIDCDGCEWKIFADWLDPEIPNLLQMQVEVHKAPGKKALQFFDGLEEAGYVRFHKEPNIQFIKGEAVEYAFLKLDKEFFSANKINRKD